MIKLEKTNVMNFENAIRGARNPLASWNRMDSTFDENGKFCFGENDLSLAKKLCRAGSDHRKFVRQIFISVDITAPIYWWKEFDTYKIGTVANSTSTMHKLASKPITIDCFEIDDLDKEVFDEFKIQNIIDICEKLRVKYVETKDKRYWKELVRWLPEGWTQTRTVTMSYENLRTMYHQRRAHKLTEWSGQHIRPELNNFVGWINSLPYAKELILYEND